VYASQQLGYQTLFILPKYKIMNIFSRILPVLLVLLWLGGGELYAKEPVGVKRKSQVGFRTSAACLPPSASAELDVNNIRTLLHNGGDMWWDLVTNPRYEVPKGSGRHSIFAGSLWIGGIDEAGQLRVAAQTYRQSGYDFWAGPLTQGGASTEEATCDSWNKMYKINKTEIDAFRADMSDGVKDGDYPNVEAWPAVGNPSTPTDADGNIPEAFGPDGNPFYLAPFVDVDGDLLYNPGNGDYPDVLGDQAVWWVINDKGDVHTETGGEAIGVEIHMLAFAFSTANAINDMTFYQQTVINRSNLTLGQTYMGQWVDPDVGNYADDYVGCDTTKGLGFAYNGDADDEGSVGYGTNPPAVGVDFFQGPLADPGDGIDNNKNGIVDEDGETIIMSKFVYYNNDFSLVGNPEIATHYYGYLRGFWKDGTPIVANGTNGYRPSQDGPETDYMFSGDPCSGIGWTEASAGNPPADRRFIQSAGPFTLQPGAVNEIITGVVWARDFVNDQFGSVCKLIEADNIAQALFDSGFELLDGPDAPNVTISEYDSEIVLNWGYTDDGVRNNFNESYAQADPVLKAQNEADSVFEFQGYLVYQTIDNTVSLSELDNPDRARIVAQCDVIDNVATIINRNETDIEGGGSIIVDEVMVQGANDGIFHSVRVTDDLFATDGDTRLRNYTPYYFTVVAYAYNDVTSDGRKFVLGNGFYELNSATPHPIDFENVGTTIGATYGDGMQVTQTAGVGNGGNFVRLTDETEAAIIANNSTTELVYQGGSAPVEVKIVDPKAVKGAEYQLEITTDLYVRTDTVAIVTNATDTTIVLDSVFAEWVLYERVNNQWESIYQSTYTERNDETPRTQRPIPLVGTDRVIEGHGISVTVRNATPAGDTLETNTGLVGAEVVYDDPSLAWLSGLGDNDDFGGEIWNWILSGQCGEGTSDDCIDDRIFRSLSIYDKNESYENILGGRWAPFAFAREFDNTSSGGDIGPGLPVGSSTTAKNIGATDLINLPSLPDVDIVMTSDVTKWSECMIVETSPNSNLGSGAWQLSGKWSESVNIDGNAIAGTKTRTAHGMGWFPGYAIDVNTGQRLNIFFGESTWDIQNRGDDMMFNPTASFGQNLDRVGGRHYVYVTNLPYDGFASLADSLRNADDVVPSGSKIAFDNGKNLASVYKHVAWVGIPMLARGFDFADFRELPTDAKVSLRINQPFRSREGTSDVPTFTFDTRSVAAATNQTDVAKDALENILVVPNPYYAYSSYEESPLQNRVKITNLPQKCDISIFSLNGHLVRQYKKDSDEPEQIWDLKNHSGVPVASGVYIIHINGFELGEKIVKMFAVMRQVDLDSY